MDAGNNETYANKLLYHNPEKCSRKKENQTKENKKIMNLYSPPYHIFTLKSDEYIGREKVWI